MHFSWLFLSKVCEKIGCVFKVNPYSKVLLYQELLAIFLLKFYTLASYASEMETQRDDTPTVNAVHLTLILIWRYDVSSPNLMYINIIIIYINSILFAKLNVCQFAFTIQFVFMFQFTKHKVCQYTVYTVYVHQLCLTLQNLSKYMSYFLRSYIV